VGLEVRLGAVGVGGDGVVPRNPGGGTGLAHVAVGPLEGLEQAQGLFHGAANLVVVDLHGADLAGGIYWIMRNIRAR
jgi:hypothetical protein